jgi:hypothetical protein
VRLKWGVVDDAKDELGDDAKEGDEAGGLVGRVEVGVLWWKERLGRAFLAMEGWKDGPCFFGAESYAGCSPGESDEQTERLESDVNLHLLKDSEEEIAGREENDEGAAREGGMQDRAGPSYLAVVRLV